MKILSLSLFPIYFVGRRDGTETSYVFETEEEVECVARAVADIPGDAFIRLR